MKKIIVTVIVTATALLASIPTASASRSDTPDWNPPAQPPAPACGTQQPADPALSSFPEPVCLDDVARVYVGWLYKYIKALEANENDWAYFYEGYIHSQNVALRLRWHQVHSQREQIRHQRHIIRQLRAELRDH
jgi:hypothetical protein